MGEWQSFQDSLTQVGAVKDGIQAEVTQEQLDAYQAHVDAGWKTLLEAVPEWADEKVSKPALQALRTHAIEEHGFSGEEVDSISDPRLMLMLKENYDLKQKRGEAKKKVTERKAKSKRLAPGGADRKGGPKKSKKKIQRAADQRAQESGSVKDAARAIELLLE
jgi:hypothetical protein